MRALMGHGSRTTRFPFLCSVAMTSATKHCKRLLWWLARLCMSSNICHSSKSLMSRHTWFTVRRTPLTAFRLPTTHFSYLGKFPPFRHPRSRPRPPSLHQSHPGCPVWWQPSWKLNPYHCKNTELNKSLSTHLMQPQKLFFFLNKQKQDSLTMFIQNICKGKPNNVYSKYM